jgi:primase-polymerase (primpol)-like protein
MKRAVRSGISDSYLVPDIRGLDKWLPWRRKVEDSGVRKIPQTEEEWGWRRASYLDADNQLPYREAKAAVEESNSETGDDRLDGLQFVIEYRADDFVVVDLDDCVDPKTGEIDDWAQKYVERGNTYTELSPSGTGLHMIFRAIPESQGWAAPEDELEGEVYDKYIVSFTGHHIVGTPYRAQENDQFLNWLFDENDIRWRELLYESDDGDGTYDAPTVEESS